MQPIEVLQHPNRFLLGKSVSPTQNAVSKIAHHYRRDVSIEPSRNRRRRDSRRQSVEGTVRPEFVFETDSVAKQPLEEVRRRL